MWGDSSNISPHREDLMKGVPLLSKERFGLGCWRASSGSLWWWCVHGTAAVVRCGLFCCCAFPFLTFCVHLAYTTNTTTTTISNSPYKQTSRSCTKPKERPFSCAQVPACFESLVGSSAAASSAVVAFFLSLSFLVLLYLWEFQQHNILFSDANAKNLKTAIKVLITVHIWPLKWHLCLIQGPQNKVSTDN